MTRSPLSSGADQRSPRADPVDMGELVDRAEAAVLVAVAEDLLRRAGPMPPSSSSCSTVAVLRLSGTTGAAAADDAGAPAVAAGGSYRDDHLAPVLELRSEVDSTEVGPATRAARSR